MEKPAVEKPAPAFTPADVLADPEPFRAHVRALAAPRWRDLAWRRTRDPYLIWISEVMLQQTQVARVEARWDDWLRRFPTVEALAAADDADVLAAWQGMGYNRRALALHRAAVAVVERHGGQFPRDRAALLDLPGVGPSTAAGILAFAFDEAGVYLETNVRAVFIHELFPPQADGPADGLAAGGAPATDGDPAAGAAPAPAATVSDKELLPLVAAACPPSGADVRGWYYALLDYGAWLKKTVPNPTRRSKSYTRQSRFEGSFRQKRAEVVRILLAAREQGVALTTERVAALLGQEERASGRPSPEPGCAAAVLAALQREGMCVDTPSGWSVGS